ncbi:MAG: hypothetical protein C4584_02755 [Armatimonadetes bacterium]|nr:MAG: hypothetical protein C4584_02755 [Armatimonadota bacterium]
MTGTSSNLHQQAITAALTAEWEQAVSLNQKILEVEPDSIDASNRLGRAYFELGNYSAAKYCFESSLNKDSYNQIAAKFIKRIAACSKHNSKNNKKAHNGSIRPISTGYLNSDIFIEEPGKTKLIPLLKVAEPQKISVLSAGTIVNLVVKNRGISITDLEGEYLGILPDDISHRLIRLIKGGNKYQACIKTTKPNALAILIREVHRSAKFKNQPSFLEGLNTTLIYSSDHLIVREEDADGEDGLYPEDDETI